MKRVLWVMVFLGLCACQKDPQTPAEVYQAFHQSISAGNWDRAITFLDPAASESFRAVGAQLSDTVGHRDDPLAFFLRGVRAEVVRPLHSVEQVSGDDQACLLKVIAGKCGEQAAGEILECSVSQVKMKRLDGRWVIVVDLPQAFTDSVAGARGG